MCVQFSGIIITYISIHNILQSNASNVECHARKKQKILDFPTWKR